MVEGLLQAHLADPIGAWLDKINVGILVAYTEATDRVEPGLYVVGELLKFDF